MSEFETLSITQSDHIAHIQFSRPSEMNSMTLAFWRELPAAVRQIDQSGDSRVIVISSTGKHFCSGMHLDAFASIGGADGVEKSRAGADLRELILELQDTANAIEQARIPVIAAVQGGCIGGAVAFLTACDMRYCTADAFFSIEETNIGMTCDVGSLQRLPHLISDTHLREWTFTGARLSAEKAHQWGLVGDVYADQQSMLEAVMEVAATIAAKSPLAIYGCKVSLNFNRDNFQQAGLEHIATWNASMLDQGDIIKSITARKTKSVPDYAPLLPRKPSS